MLLASDIGACARRELVRHAGRDRAQPARRARSRVQCQWWPACSTSIEPAAAALEASAAFGIGVRVLNVENGLLKIFNFVCDRSAAASDRPSQSKVAGGRAVLLLLCCWPSGARGLLLWLLLLLELLVVLLAVLLLLLLVVVVQV